MYARGVQRLCGSGHRGLAWGVDDLEGSVCDPGELVSVGGGEHAVETGRAVQQDGLVGRETESALSSQITESRLGPFVYISKVLVKCSFVVRSEAEVPGVTDLFHCFVADGGGNQPRQESLSTFSSRKLTVHHCVK